MCQITQKLKPCTRTVLEKIGTKGYSPINLASQRKHNAKQINQIDNIKIRYSIVER